MKMIKNPKVYLVPTPLAEEGLKAIPEQTISIAKELTHFVVEKEKTARRFFKAIDISTHQNDLEIFELDKHAAHQDFSTPLAWLKAGQSIGLLSEAGCPGVADPGKALVAIAHDDGYEVCPLVGPSSILLALMASGMNGQQFNFNGYLPAKKEKVKEALKKLESSSSKFKRPEIFIETPYRNQQIIEEAFKALSPRTRFAIATDLTAPTQWIKVKTIQQWKKEQMPSIHKRPTVFIIQG